MPKASTDIWFLYIVRCADGTLYTGIARDVQARIAQHDAGKGARYTRGRGPLTLCAVRRFRSKGAALSLEHAIKQLPRPAKEQLIEPGHLSRLRIRKPRTR
ncbi:MAG TPA: GIY-YIG nuclease family protein [Polyangiales bacterium]|nr:GIY-YIG nuclease family protein [Polyangiales bacterium]